MKFKVTVLFVLLIASFSVTPQRGRRNDPPPRVPQPPIVSQRLFATVIRERQRLYERINNRDNKSDGPKLGEIRRKDSFSIIEKAKPGEVKLQLTYLDLKEGGSTTIVKIRSDKIAIIDTGKSRNDALDLMAKLDKEYGGNTKSIDVIITHPDADHINGLRYLIEAGRPINDIILPNTYRGERAKAKIKTISKMLQGHGYSSSITNKGKLLRFHKGLSIEIPLEKNDDLSGKMPLNMYDLKMDSEVDFKVIQYLNPKSVNDQSLISRIQYNGISHLNMGDAGIKVIKSLLDAKVKIVSHIFSKISYLETLGSDITITKELKGATSETELIKYRQELEKLDNEFVAKKREIDGLYNYMLKSTILQWPHHFWSLDGKIRAHKLILNEFLKEVDPEIIIFTNPPRNANQQRRRLENYIHQFEWENNRKIKLHFLEDTKSLKILSEIFSIRVDLGRFQLGFISQSFKGIGYVENTNVGGNDEDSQKNEVG